MNRVGTQFGPTGVTQTRKHEFGFWVLIAYFFVEYVRPQDRLPVVGALKVGLILTCLSALLWVMRGDKNVMREPLIKFYIGLVLLAALTVPLAVNNFWAYQSTQALALVFVAGVLPSTTLLADPARLFKFFRIWIVFHVLITLSSIQTSGRGSGGFLSDENDFALAIVMAIPFAYFMSQSPRVRPRTKLMYLGAVAILTFGVIITSSRGGLVGLAGCLLMILLLAKHKIRNLLLLSIVSLGVLTIVQSSFEGRRGGTLFSEIESIGDAEDSTRKDRIYMWERAVEMYLDHPFIGVGAGNFPWRIFEYQMKTPDWDPSATRHRGGRVAHSLYFTVIAELGSVGAFFYLGMIWMVVRKLLGVMKTKSNDPDTHLLLTEYSLLAKAMLVSLGGYLLSGTFISVLYYPHFSYLIGFAIALSYCAVRLVKDTGKPATRFMAPV